MIKDLQPATGLPIRFDTESCELLLGEGLNNPSYCTRRVNDLGQVWANPVEGENRVIYRYTAGLHLEGDEQVWKNADVIYGIVIFPPGEFSGEYVKSSGQYHPPIQPCNMATSEVYTVLSGTGYFMMQKATGPDYDDVSDPVMVEVHEGETFIVPPDYGHLQINPADEPLVFSYAVKPMSGVYDPYKKRQGSAFYVMADPENRFVKNENYDADLKLRIVKAGDICQVPEVNDNVDYHLIRENLSKLPYLTDPTTFPESAAL